MSKRSKIRDRANAAKNAGNHVKSLTKCLVFEGRAKLADGLYAAAEFVDTTEEQKSYAQQFRDKLAEEKATKAQAKEFAKTKVEEPVTA